MKYSFQMIAKVMYIRHVTTNTYQINIYLNVLQYWRSMPRDKFA